VNEARPVVGGARMSVSDDVVRELVQQRAKVLPALGVELDGVVDVGSAAAALRVHTDGDGRDAMQAAESPRDAAKVAQWCDVIEVRAQPVSFQEPNARLVGVFH
jgi:hypothetical protein